MQEENKIENDIETKKTFLVTGGAGFIGSNLVKRLYRKYPDCQIVIVDNFRTGDFKNLIDFKGELVVGSLLDEQIYGSIAKEKFDAIFHLASITETTNSDQFLQCRENIHGFKIVLNLSNFSDCPLIYASSASVYGKELSTPSLEDDFLNPGTVYSFTKSQMDQMANRIIKDSNSRICGLRFFNVYGPNEEAKGNAASMVYQILNKLNNGKKVWLFNPGTQQRDFVYVEDVADFMIFCCERSLKGIFNCGSGSSNSFLDVFWNAFKLNNLDKSNEEQYLGFFENPYKFYQSFTQADLRKAKSVGWEPKYSLEEGMRETFFRMKLKNI